MNIELVNECIINEWMADRMSAWMNKWNMYKWTEAKNKQKTNKQTSKQTNKQKPANKPTNE